MSALPSPPFVTVEGIHNFRDLGDYPVSTIPSKSVRSNIIFRCAEPSQITPNGIQTLRSLGVTAFFDLRSGPEIEKMKAHSPVVEIEGIDRVLFPSSRTRITPPNKSLYDTKTTLPAEPVELLGHTRISSEVPLGAIDTSYYIWRRSPSSHV